MKATNLLNEIESLTKKGCRFVSINNYESKTSGEIAKYTINLGISIQTAKEQDFEKLKNCKILTLKKLSKESDIPMDIFTTAWDELLTSAEKNLSENIEDRTAQSKAQTGAYVTITNGLKLCKATMELHIFGQFHSKETIKKGIYKEVKSAPKTIAKNMIKKELDMRTDKFRNFVLNNIETVKMNGETFEIN